MDLYSGYPYSLINNKIESETRLIWEDTECEVVIIGAGISGVLSAEALLKRGIDCCIVDKRLPGIGSTIASTSLIQYEIDTPLYQLIERYGEREGVYAYTESLRSVTELEEILKAHGVDAEFESKSSLYLAALSTHAEIIEKEFEARKTRGFPVEYLRGKDLWSRFAIERRNAILSGGSAQMDAYAATSGLLKSLIKKYDLRVFSHCKVVSIDKNQGIFTVTNDKNIRIKAKHVIVASGYESGVFLPEKVMDLVSTYAFLSSQIEEEYLECEDCLIWETGDPYLYIRRTKDRRIIVGGEDMPFRSPTMRQEYLEIQIPFLKKKFSELFPNIEYKIDFSWASTFSTTDDGLPYIGEYQGMRGIYFALGYGGNGITFSVIASKIIAELISGEREEVPHIFSFKRRDDK